MQEGDRRGVLRQAIGKPAADAEPLGGLLQQRLQVERDVPTLGGDGLSATVLDDLEQPRMGTPIRLLP